MAHEFVVKNGLIVNEGGANITGSVKITGIFSGSGAEIFGVVSSSYATTSSHATSVSATNITGTVTSASYTLSASHAETSDLAALATTSTSASYALTASAATSITFVPATASFAISASWAPGGQGTVGPGTTNTIAKFTSTSTIGDSALVDGGVYISSSLPISGTSFTGSFRGEGSQVTGVISSSYSATSSFASTASFAVLAQATLQGSVSASYALSASHAEVADNVNGSIASATSASYALSASHAETSDLAEVATTATSASYALTSSAATSITFVPATASFAVTASAATSITFTPATASFAISASWAPGGQGTVGPGTTNTIAKFTSTSTIGDSALIDGGVYISSSLPISGTSFTGSFLGNGAQITGVISSSYTISASHAETSDLAALATTATSASYALSASHAETSDLAAVATTTTSASYALTSSAATSITFVPVTASFAITASAATSLTFTASRTQLPPEIAYEDEANVFRANQTITGSLLISGGNINATGYSITASEFKGGGSQVTGVISSSYALSASHAETADTLLGSVVSASYALTSSYASIAQNLLGSIESASFAEMADTASYISGGIWDGGGSSYIIPSASTSASILHAQAATSASFATTASYTSTVGYINFIVDAISGSINTLGFKGSVQIPMSISLHSASLYASGSGSIHFDIRRHQYGTWSPLQTTGTSITGSTRLSMSNHVKYTDTSSMQGWTTSLAPDDILNYYVYEVEGGIQRVTVSLRIAR